MSSKRPSEADKAIPKTKTPNAVDATAGRSAYARSATRARVEEFAPFHSRETVALLFVYQFMVVMLGRPGLNLADKYMANDTGTPSQSSNTPRKDPPPGTIIFREGEMGHQAYYVHSGAVEVSRRRNGQKVSLAIIGPGGIFGEMALIDRQTRDASATAQDETVCLVISEQKLHERIHQADPVIRSLLGTFIQTIRSLNDRTTKAEVGGG